MENLIEPAPPTELTQTLPSVDEDEEASGIRAGSSAKIDQLVHLLKLTPSTEKSLVFSQFTSFLDKVNAVCTVGALINHFYPQIEDVLEEHG
jgi:SWI/SNF-related matrix-associated actin-dependent regulator of chromatin subfamily A3